MSSNTEQIKDPNEEAAKKPEFFLLITFNLISLRKHIKIYSLKGGLIDSGL